MRASLSATTTIDSNDSSAGELVETGPGNITMTGSFTVITPTQQRASTTKQKCHFQMLVNGGASEHFIVNKLLDDIDNRLLEGMKSNPCNTSCMRTVTLCME